MGNQVSRKVKSPNSKAGSSISGGSIKEKDIVNLNNKIYPLNPNEANRLQTLHYLLKHVFQTSFFAPIEEQLNSVHSRVVDIGCGAYASWVADIANEFPNCKVQGLDNVDISGFQVPNNVEFIKGDLFDGLPFPDSSIDFVHQRMMKSVYPTGEIPTVLADMYRILKPGGWLELVEPEVLPRRAGPLMTKLFTQVNGLLVNRLGNHLMGDDAKKDLKEAGFEQVKTDYGSIPMCWGGYMGKMFYDDMITILRNMGPMLYEDLGFQGPYDEAKYEEYVDKAFDECVEYQTYFDIHWTIGQKPMDS